MATHCSILAWRIPWSEKRGGLLSMGSHRVRHDWSDLACMHTLKKEMATHFSILAWRIPGTEEPGGLPSMGWHRVGHDWSDLAAAAAAEVRSQDLVIERAQYSVACREKAQWGSKDLCFQVYGEKYDPFSAWQGGSSRSQNEENTGNPVRLSVQHSEQYTARVQQGEVGLTWQFLGGMRWTAQVRETSTILGHTML